MRLMGTQVPFLRSKMDVTIYAVFVLSHLLGGDRALPVEEAIKQAKKVIARF